MRNGRRRDFQRPPGPPRLRSKCGGPDPIGSEEAVSGLMRNMAGIQRRSDAGGRREKAHNNATVRSCALAESKVYGRKYCSLTAPPDRRERTGVPVE
jgi:hypothetical protein